MANFDDAVTTVLANEGGYIDNPDDTGGATNFGISKHYLNSVGRPCIDMHTYTRDEAILEYKRLWDSNHYNLIDNNQMATSLFSACVNLGQKIAVKLLQQAYTFIARRKITVDGILGIQTLEAINKFKNQDELLSQFRNNRSELYKSLFLNNPLKNKYFIKGWLKVSQI